MSARAGDVVTAVDMKIVKSDLKAFMQSSSQPESRKQTCNPRANIDEKLHDSRK
jgi:hypothetical protein